MSSTPDRDTPEDQGGGQQTAHPGEQVPQQGPVQSPAQAPGQPQVPAQSSTPEQAQPANPGSAIPMQQQSDAAPPADDQQRQPEQYEQQRSGQQDQYSQQDQYGQQGQYVHPDQYGQQPVQPGGRPAAAEMAAGAGMAGAGIAGAGMAASMMPVAESETRVTGRRVFQYIVDYILAGIIPGLAYWLFNRGSGVLHGFGWLIATAIALAVYFYYWVVRPYNHRGQTYGMQLFSVRVISKDGGPASMMQLLIRGILLIVDTLVFGLVGLITMLFSRFRQRVGDHAAKTVVVKGRRHVSY